MNYTAKGLKTFGVVTLAIVSISVLALGLVQAQQEPALAELALKPDDLKGLPGTSGFKFIKSGPSSITDSTQPLNNSNANTLLSSASVYEEAYAVAATVGDDASRVGAFVGNYLYRYPDPTQARGIADQVIGAILHYPGGHLISLETQDGPISGRAATFIGSGGDAIYWFVGTQDNILILLMVNGPSTPSTEGLFKALAVRILR